MIALVGWSILPPVEKLRIFDIIGSVIALTAALIAVVITGIATTFAGKGKADIYCIVPEDNTKSKINAEAFWLTQKAMAQLFGVEVPASYWKIQLFPKWKQLRASRIIKLPDTYKSNTNM